MKLFCPLCNWDIEEGECTNTISHCRYKGPGVPRERLDGSLQLGDMTGEPQNNGDYSSQNYD